ncbi:MAG: hypothetical protein ACD_40C00055G0004 [uncultured bacterium]|nr:MAG: hypothetical protein ACD_40C00055G0004 [uncultured bacterium]
MNTSKFSRFIPFVALIVLIFASLACGGGYMPLPYVDAGFGNPDSTQSVEPTSQPVEIQPNAAPQATTQGETSYKVNGDTVEVYASDTLIAKIRFLTKVDNMPTEWLRDRPVAYLYQSGIGNEVKLEITLFENGAFASDGDAFQFGDTTLGKVNDSADALVFADIPGKYNLTGWSFGIAFSAYRASDDKAGNVLEDRHNAINWDSRPEYWLNPTGDTPVQVNQ